ncbi:MAG: Lrp/AsnC family transcriptional regulator [Thermoplasmatota archaeon]
MKSKMDDLDIAILNMLKENSRISNVAVANRLKVSEGMIRQRIGKLRRSGIIKQYTIKISSKGLKAIIEVNTKINVHSTKIARMIKDLEGIETVFEVSGEVDIVAIIDVADTRELNNTIESIRSMENVVSTRTKLILNEV